MKKEVKLYNVIFPVWVLWLIPFTWIFVLPANFLIDLIVIVCTLKYLKISEIKQKAKSVILKTWLFGFAADFIGTALMILALLIDFDINTPFGRWWYDNLTNSVALSPFDNIFSVLWVAACVVITAGFIYLFNYRICLKKLDVEDGQRKKLALSLAVFTAPYLFFLPTTWFF